MVILKIWEIQIKSKAMTNKAKTESDMLAQIKEDHSKRDGGSTVRSYVVKRVRSKGTTQMK